MNEQELQQLVNIVKAEMGGNQLAALWIQQVEQAAQQGDKKAQEYVLMIQNIKQQLQGLQLQSPQSYYAKQGAKLQYIKSLRGQCPEGYEMGYFKAGGHICKKCMKKLQGGNMPQEQPLNPIDAFKCGRKIKKNNCGSKIKFDKCGSKVKK